MRAVRNISAIVFFCLTLSSPAIAETGDNLNVDLLGRWASGTCFDVVLADSIVYAGDGAILRVLDVSNPAAPALLGSVVLPSYIRRIALQGDYAYVANHYDGLRIVDISNPTAPFETGSFPAGDAVSGVDVQGNYAYVADSGNGLRIVDISNPAAPFEVGFINIMYTWDVAVEGNLAFIGGYWSGHWDEICAIDVSNPAVPVQGISADVHGDPRKIRTNGNFVYVTANGSDITQFTVIDYTIPGAPVERGRHSELFVSSSGLALDGNTAYLLANKNSTGTGGLYVIDVSNPDTIVERGYIETPGFTAAAVAGAGVAYVACRDRGVRAIDVTNPDTPADLGNFETAGAAIDIAVVNNTVYLADREDGIHVLDVSNPSQPAVIGAMQTAGVPIDIAIRNDLLYISDGDNGLLIADASNPAALSEVGRYDVGSGEVWDCQLRGDLAYLATNSRGLRIVNISNPAAPVEVGGITPLVSTVGLDVRYPYAYLAVGSPGMFIIDVSNPAAPVEVGHYDSSNARDVAIAPDGIHAFLADGAGGIRIIDVSDPTDPQDIHQFSTVDYAREIYIHNGFAYVAAEEDGLRVFDVSSPASAFETGYYDTADHAIGVKPGGTRVFVADQYAGLWIFDNTQATPVVLAAFDLRAEVGRVNLRWELSEVSTQEEFRLTRFHAGRNTQLDWHELDRGVYEAIDTGTELREGGDFEYRLYGRETGEMWQLLRSESIDLTAAPLTSRIDRAWPNPFNPTTNIRFTLADKGPALVTIIDVNGALVTKLHDGPLPAGEHDLVWNGLDARGMEVASGIYFVHLAGAGTKGNLKLVLIR